MNGYRAGVKGRLPAHQTDVPDAKQRLLEAGLELFGLYNLEGTTTRQLAHRAGVNQAAIPYYFGGKEGLYLAVVQHLFSNHVALLKPVLEEVGDGLASEKLTKPEALRLLKLLLSNMLELMCRRGASATWARILVREQMQPTAAFDFLYANAYQRIHEVISGLLAAILERKAAEPGVVLRAHMVIGQVLIFLAGRETIRRRLGLTGYTDKEIWQIQGALADQLDLFCSGG